MFKLIKIFKIIIPLIQFYPWGIPVIIILGIFASLAEGIGISLLIPFLQNLQSGNSPEINISIIKNLDQYLINFEPQQRVIFLIISILVSILVKAGLSYIYTALCSWLENYTLHKLRTAVYQQLMEVSQSFWDRNKSGELLNLIFQETAYSIQVLTFLIWLIINLCMISIFGLLLLLISWKLTLLVTLAFLLISGLIHTLTAKIAALGQESQQANSYLSNLILENFTGIKTIRAFGRENHEESRYQQASKQCRDLNVKLQKQTVMIEPVSEGLAVATLVFIMLIAFYTQISFPVLIIFILMLYRLLPQVQRFNYNFNQVIALSYYVKSVFSLLERDDKPYINSGNINFQELNKGITFDAVSFLYHSQNKPALEKLSLFIPQGQTTALVGSSGAGKSTIINLIFRFYDVTSGEIYIDDYPIKELELSAWRSHISLVSQDVHIFSSTVRENIAYGRPDAKDAEIIEAAKQAHAHEFICELYQGYDTFVGDRGIKLSGGQKQRISIARAILCNPKILILDEATNSLDNISEKLIQEAINILRHNRTVIVIAHRLSTIENADQIIVLKQGKVEEQGSFVSLMHRQGVFHKLYKLEYQNHQN
ncbi:ABC transporter ATP-binding protein [Nodularia sphaerocarpa]|uniref:ABC transporter ATP-binding protein n=1 Tax=Nodularia sphaerocarpa TaxID=137816 RepID=UPI001EFA8800|nr:ABC transporter ATP-binding protein [Nodularia sphaerocarpa]MDB9372526.1 ABC transporter ATP-binding protein [Nodularia sphaerocarpa CS-585]MDB9376924.1 ABC transporter ATP-binding protein [Nodularia sphaerocarpa CS-585A2]ULP73657.1 Heterocyst differentiation ATP-binding protein HepA [Nodularia sphaerocarpa UHCC 0038]